MFESEEDKIAERIKKYIKKEKPPSSKYIMLRNGYILDIDDYRKMVSNGKINPMDAYVYIRIVRDSSETSFRYPFIFWYDDILFAYLSKLALHHLYFEVPATGLKYVAVAARHKNYLAIELVNLDTTVNNTNLRKIVVEVLDGKLISGGNELTDEEYKKIRDMFRSQKLFAGYDFDEALNILYEYYYYDNRSLAKEVARITMDYDKIFQPYRTCYDMNNWKEVDCWSIKLD